MALSNDLAALIGFALESLFYGPPSPIIQPPAIANLPLQASIACFSWPLLPFYYGGGENTGVSIFPWS